ncbi:hypothetical protein TL18_02515 [Methanobrevibacter sp. YE315]|uniref:DUF308 domain-containing protein n=1 Tax=Methanobrevibacter sp. YE315 TaxID=1609968 RepID=UPI000764E657|nr:DUF308 domain-containing protein [Methanobrevibacter sp. YE315]AMD16993.1 hypothetical protein TL18_02515 [Methanobrevibacter sp. YE315]
MDSRKILGIIFIILGLLFVIYPFYSAAAVSWIAGICLICFGFASIIDGFSIWSMMAHVSLLDILIGICAILLGIMFIYEIDALSFITAYLFYLIAFVLILAGIFGILFSLDTLSRLTSVLILILGIVAVYLAFASLAQPLYVAIIVGICLIMEGILFLASGIADSN